MRICVVSNDRLKVRLLCDKLAATPLQEQCDIVTRSTAEFSSADICDNGYIALFIDSDLEKEAIRIAKKSMEEVSCLDIIYFGHNTLSVYTLYSTKHLAFLNMDDLNPYLDVVVDTLMKRKEELDSTFLHIHWKNVVYLVQNDNVMYIERDKRRTLIHTLNGSLYMTYQHIDEFEEPLGKGFARVHFSYIVNLKMVEEYHSTHLILKGNLFIPISRKYTQEIKELYFKED